MLSFLRRSFKFVVIALFLVCFVILISNNNQTISLSLAPLSYQIEFPFFVYAIGFFFFGFVIAGIVSLGKNIARAHDLRKANKRIAALENEVHSLRAEKL